MGNYPPSSVMTDYYTGVGRIAVAWAFFETHVNRAIWELANVEQYAGACITSQIIQSGPRFRALIALVNFRGGKAGTIKKLNSMSNGVDSLARRRNRFAHDPAAPDEQGNFHRLEITADRKLEFAMLPSEIAQLERLENDIKAMTERFYRLYREILAELPPFPNIQFGQSPGIDLGPPPNGAMTEPRPRPPSSQARVK